MSPAPVPCSRIDVHIYFHLCPCPPRGVSGVTAREVKGPHMAADVQVLFTPDSDPNVQNAVCSFLVNGSPVGFVAVPNSSGMANYLGISPPPPPLAAGDVVTGSIITTDNIGQSSPSIPFPAVTIAAAPPPPQGVTDVTSKQVGTP